METATLLNSFISDSNAGSLKTSQYPKELKGLKMKVSFGMGAAARVPWISFFTPEMSTSNGYYPVYLYFKTENKLVLAFGVSETNDFGKSWDEQIIGSAPTISDNTDISNKAACI